MVTAKQNSKIVIQKKKQKKKERKERKKSKHNTKDSHQITREGNKRRNGGEKSYRNKSKTIKKCQQGGTH